MQTYLVSLKIDEKVNDVEIKADSQQEAINKAKQQLMNGKVNESNSVSLESVNELLKG